MQELQYLIVGQFLVATLMGLGALCLFVWAAAAGLLRDVEPVKYQVLDCEGIKRGFDPEGIKQGLDPEGIERGLDPEGIDHER
jgi:hypothetical protein